MSRRGTFAGRVLALLLLTISAAGWLRGATVAFTPADAALAYAVADGFVTDCTPRDAGTPQGRAAAYWLKARARRAGVSCVVDEFTAPTPSGTGNFANVLAEFYGTNPQAPWIVLVSHFDTKSGCGAGFQGANDGASTSGLLLAFGAALRRAGKLRDNVLLAWTDAEECRVQYGPRDGFQGSRRLVSYLRARGRTVKAAICLDMLGDRDLSIQVPANGTTWLRQLVLKSARDAQVASSVHLFEEAYVADDHAAFLEAGWPAVDLIDFAYGSAPDRNDYWHTPLDRMDKVSATSLNISGRLVAALVNRLLCRD